MAKESRNFRLAKDVLDEIKQLSASWGVSQAQVIEILVREAKGRKLKTTKPG